MEIRGTFTLSLLSRSKDYSQKFILAVGRDHFLCVLLLSEDEGTGNKVGDLFPKVVEESH
jgi:hypothetical protein